MNPRGAVGEDPRKSIHIVHVLGSRTQALATKKRLADRIGLSERQVQCHIAALGEAGLVERIERTRPEKDKTSNEYEMAGLVVRLKKLDLESPP